MMPNHLSAWDKLQLRFLRLLVTVLGTVDGMLNVHWGERLLEHLAGRWQSQLIELDEAMESLKGERDLLQRQAEALALHSAAVYLGGRRMTRDELVFDPSDPHDEEILDASIDLLVKARLAAIEPEQIKEGVYVYHLEPDWVGIRTRLEEAMTEAEPDVADWIREGLVFIDEAFLSAPAPDTGNQTSQQAAG